MDRIFSGDILSKRERVERTLKHLPVDRAAIHEQVSYNPDVIAHYANRPVSGFDYTLDDICQVIKHSLDMCFPPSPPRGTGEEMTEDGFLIRNDNWTFWHVSRPFSDPEGARDWLLKKTDQIRRTAFDPDTARIEYRNYMQDLQRRIGDCVILNYSWIGFCTVFDLMGLELFAYFYEDYPGVFNDFLQVSVEREIERIHAVADIELSPVILVPEDFATKQGPIFPPAFMHREHYTFVKRVTEAWHSHGITVLYHSDGNYRKALPDLIDCGVDGFYCLEPSVGMDIVELKNSMPEMVWAGGVDGVDLMERGTPEAVRVEVQRHILQTNALHTGGMFVATSSEINPPIKLDNYLAMIEAVGTLTNPELQ